MEAQDLIVSFHQRLNEVEARGARHVQVSALRAYLAALERDAAASKDHRQEQHEGILAQYAAENDHRVEMLKAILEAGKSALNALLITNGGAAVALLGVMSNLAGRDGGDVLARYLALPLLQFGIGVLCGALGFACRYFSQAAYSDSAGDDDKHHRQGSFFKNAAITCAIVGFALFGLAIANAYNAVRWAFAHP